MSGDGVQHTSCVHDGTACDLSEINRHVTHNRINNI
jgi:hypothetical protein